MKTKVLFGLLLSCIALSSCQKDDLTYSCDEKVDQWTKSNLSEIQKMEIIDFLKLDYDYQRATYRAMNPSQRYNIWIAKLADVIRLDWDQASFKHLESLISYIEKKTPLFDNMSQENEMDEFELFMYKWMEYAKTELLWDKETIYSICGDPNQVTVVKTRSNSATLKIRIAKSAVNRPKLRDAQSESEGLYGDCACSQESDWCDIVGEIPSMVVSCNSNNYKCNVRKKACGTFWMFDCNGICKSPFA